jgi:hypothetical protein
VKLDGEDRMHMEQGGIGFDRRRSAEFGRLLARLGRDRGLALG